MRDFRGFVTLTTGMNLCKNRLVLSQGVGVSKKRVRWFLTKKIWIRMLAARKTLGIKNNAELIRISLDSLSGPVNQEAQEEIDSIRKLGFIRTKMPKDETEEAMKEHILLELVFTEEAYHELQAMRVYYDRKNTAEVIGMAFGNLVDQMDQWTYLKYQLDIMWATIYFWFTKKKPAM